MMQKERKKERKCHNKRFFKCYNKRFNTTLRRLLHDMQWERVAVNLIITSLTQTPSWTMNLLRDGILRGTEDLSIDMVTTYIMLIVVLIIRFYNIIDISLGLQWKLIQSIREGCSDHMIYMWYNNIYIYYIKYSAL